MKRLNLTVLGLLMFMIAYCASVVWHLESDNSAVTFQIKNFGKQVEGTFGGMKADINFDEKSPAQSKLRATVQVKTIDTGIKKRDQDLMSEKYFDADNFPLIEFDSKSVSQTSNGYLAKGNLTIKGVTHEVILPFTFENKGDHGEFIGTLALDRLDYHVGGKTKILGDHVSIRIKADVNK
jgi:polyisoprenoid-binding protein YceI